MNLFSFVPFSSPLTLFPPPPSSPSPPSDHQSKMSSHLLETTTPFMVFSSTPICLQSTPRNPLQSVDIRSFRNKVNVL